MKTTATAYSYVRFSTPEQAKGDSLRRQTEATRAWCEKNGVGLDESTTLRDLGKSAYTGAHRQNPDRHALALFLKLVEGGRVSRGSFLVIENLDRLSREHEVAACHLLTSILMAGVNVVQLSPYEMMLTEKSNGWELMRAVMELSRGHGESKIKSERVGSAWAEKKACARRGDPQPVRRQDRVNGMKVLTHKLPAWVEERGGRLHLIGDRAAVIKRIFQLAAAGYGQKLTAARLAAENVPVIGRAPHWNGSYVGTILRDRRALGEFQPRFKRTRKPDGPAIANYFPAAVTEAEWLAARAGARERLKKRGRTGPKHVNAFAGLLRNARDGDSYYCAVLSASGGRGTAPRVLVNSRARDGDRPLYSFPYATFERAVLSRLAEVDPREVLGQEDTPDEVQVLSGELAGVEAKIGEFEAELLNGDVAALAKVLRHLEGRKRDLTAELAEARQRAATPLGESWGEAQGLLAALENAPDPRDARLRLRSALRRVISEIWLLVVPVGKYRLAAVQIFFSESDKHRDYIILHVPKMSNGKASRPGDWFVKSFASTGLPADALDLRKRQHAARLAKLLESIKPSDLSAD
jgi:DNA invertase Pin-like site-specific DNA recombinase